MCLQGVFLCSPPVSSESGDRSIGSPLFFFFFLFRVRDCVLDCFAIVGGGEKNLFFSCRLLTLCYVVCPDGNLRTVSWIAVGHQEVVHEVA